MIAVVLELGGRSVARFRGRFIFADLHFRADLRRRYGALGVDIYLKRKLARENLTEEQIIAETDKSNGVLLASGYIAGGAIAGILIALFASFRSFETA